MDSYMILFNFFHHPGALTGMSSPTSIFFNSNFFYNTLKFYSASSLTSYERQSTSWYLGDVPQSPDSLQ